MRGHVKHTCAGGAAHPFQAGGDGKIDLRRLHIIGDQAGGLGDIGADQAAHLAAMGDHAVKVNAVAGGGGNPCEQGQSYLRGPSVDEIFVFDIGGPLAQWNGLQGEIVFFRHARQQEVVRGEAICADKDCAAFEIGFGQGGKQRMEGGGDVFGTGDGLRGGVEDGAPMGKEFFAFAKHIGPLCIIGAGPNFGKFLHGRCQIGGFAGIHADGMVKKIGLGHFAAMHRGIFKLSLEIGGCGCQGLEKADELAFAAKR
jgi:hypothetical protein